MIFGGEQAGDAPVFRVDLIDDDMRPLRAFAQRVLQGFGDLGDNPGFLLGGGAPGDPHVDVWHGLTACEVARLSRNALSEAGVVQCRRASGVGQLRRRLWIGSRR